MKKFNKRILLFFAVILFFCGYRGYRAYNLKYDDKLSRSVRDTLGKDFYFIGKEERDSGEVWYRYQIKKQDKEAVAYFVSTLNESLQDEQGKKVSVIVSASFSCGLERVFYIQNFSAEGVEEEDMDGMYEIHIRVPKDVIEKSFYEPFIYTDIEGIQRLYIDAEMQQKAEEAGIDWYECWPDLKEVIVDE